MAVLLLAACAVALIATAGAAVWAGSGAALVMAISAVRPSRHRPDVGGLHELQRHLARARRAGASAYVLVAEIPRERAWAISDLLKVLRLADSVAVRPSRGGWRVLVMADAEPFELEGLQRRIGASAARPQCGWAAFPDDALTLHELVARASASRGQQTAGMPRATDHR
jgi:hypothetical protein